MELRDVGEFGLIERIARRARRARASASAQAGVVLGLGDDAAVLRLGRHEELVVTCDSAVEGVHFRWTTTAPRIVGRRAWLAAASDLSAMGARPLGFLMALCAPPSLPLARLEHCVDGMLAEAGPLACPLVGGNVTRGPVTMLTFTLLGAVRRGRALRRDAARPGDRLFVTGVIGAAALDRLRAERGAAGARHVPPSRSAAGLALARMDGVGACIDLSDGLLADLGHILRASRVGAELDLARLPVPRGFGPSCARLKLDPRSLALRGGEDYELLFTLHGGRQSEAALSRRLGAPVREIGRIVRGRGIRGFASGGDRGVRGFASGGGRGVRGFASDGFTHF